MKLLLGSTPIALWYEIIHQAESTCMVSLKEDLESYLVFLLMRYMDKPQVLTNIIAHEFLRGAEENYHKRQSTLQEVGDKCLLFSGLFPHIAERRLVKVSYFVGMGQTAYSAISQKNNDLYGLLSHHFVPLMDVLQSVRRYTNEFKDLLPLEAYELWDDTGSRRALRVLGEVAHAVPISQRKF